METYSFVTYSKTQSCYNFVFENDMKDGEYLKVKLLPRIDMLFNELDIHHMKLRDPEIILDMLSYCGLTIIEEIK